MDPRTERTRRTAHTAALTLLSEGGIAHLTPQNLSRLSGLGRTTLYRHWPTTVHLVLDLLKTFRMPDFEMVEGDLPARLRHNIAAQHAWALDPEYNVVFQTIQTVALDEEVRDALVEINRERIESVARVLEPEYDLHGRNGAVAEVFALINGPLLHLATFTEASSPRLMPAIVASVMAYLEENCA